MFVIMFFFSCFLSCCFFSIVNFNNNNPVDLGITMYFTIIAMSFVSYVEIGMLQAIILQKKSIIFVIILNISIISLGLVFRYLLEFGEISNVYNFTIKNVLFHVFILTLFCLVGFVSKRNKQNI